MNCLDFRRALLADPTRLDAGMSRHAGQCPACAQFRAKSIEWEADLAEALRAKVSARGLTAVVVTAAGGSVTVIARSSQSVERIAQALATRGGS